MSFSCWKTFYSFPLWMKFEVLILVSKAIIDHHTVSLCKAFYDSIVPGHMSICLLICLFFVFPSRLYTPGKQGLCHFASSFHLPNPAPCLILSRYMGFPGGARDKETIQVLSPGWDDPQEEGMASHSSILAWRIPWTEESGGLYSPWSGKELDTTEAT